MQTRYDEGAFLLCRAETHRDQRPPVSVILHAASTRPGGAAGWGEPDRRYWLDRAEMGRRLNILGAKYESVGIQAEGRSHDLDFAAEPDQRNVGLLAAV